MKNNDSLFRKAYNNHHDMNGSDVSSTADSLMRSDIGDGVSLDGENFSNANGDDRPNAWSDPIPLGGESGGNSNGDGLNVDVSDFYALFQYNCMLMMQQITGQTDPILVPGSPWYQSVEFSGKSNANGGEDFSEFLWVECNTPYGDGSYCGQDFPGYTRYAEFGIMNFLDNLAVFLNYPPFLNCMNQEIGGQENSNLRVGNQLAFRFRLIAQSIYKISDYTNMTELFQKVANVKAKLGAEARSQANYPMTNGVSPGSKFILPLQTGESAGQPDCYEYPLHCLHNAIAETEQTLYNYISGEGTSTGVGVSTIDEDFDYGYEGWKTNVLNDAGYWINKPFETEQIDVSISWAFGNFGAISPTPTGNGQCLPGGEGSSFPMNELMSKLGAPSEGSNPVNPESETYINQWFKFNVTACYEAYQLSGADVRPLTQWDGKIYVKIISAINFFDFKPIFKVGYFVALDDGYFFENLGEMISAYQQVYPNTQGQPIGSVVVEPAWLPLQDGMTPVRTLNQLYEYANQGGVEPQPTSEQGTVLGNLFDAIVGTNPPNPYGDTQSLPSWITPNAPGLPDIQSCSGITSELYQMYSPYLTAYTPFNFNVDGGTTIGNILNQLEGQNIGFYTGEAMQSFNNYVALVTAGLLCAAGMDESSSPDLDSFWNNLPESCQLQSYSGNGNDGANGEAIYYDEPASSTDDGGGMVGDDPTIANVPDRPRNFSNANGNNNQALIQQLNYIKNWFKDNPIDRDMFASGESFELYHIGNGEMAGGASSLYQMQSSAFDSNNPEISWAVNRFKSLQDWYKVGNFVEMFFSVFVRIANCLPTDVKNACTSLLQEIMARNTEFFVVETDEEQEFRDMFQELGMPVPPNFFREYTSLEYNELANQLEQSQGVINGLASQIDTLNTQYMMVQNELNNITNMMEYEQDNTEELQEEIAQLIQQRIDLEAELTMFMAMLYQTEAEFMQVIEENGMLQAELGASQQLQMVLQDQFDTAVMNEMALENMVNNLQGDLISSNNQIAQLQKELNDVISDLVTQVAIGDDMQNALQTQLANSQSEISQLTTQIANLQTQLAITEGQIEANTINQQDVAYYENQISNLNQANQSLLLTIQEMEMQTGQTATDLGSGIVQVQGQIDMKTGKGTIQILRGKPQRPQRPVREKKPTISKDGKRLNFVAHNPMKDLNPWSYMDGEHRRFNNSYDLDN